MSTINTNGINVNYPVPGVNNNSQGFRDNFASIKNNLNIAGTEISDLQNKVVVKAALENTTVNNDMANTLISNASTKNFRATTYNLGNALSGTVVIDTSLGDVHTGTVTGNVTLQFSNWAPAGTQREIELQLAISNTSATISFPSEVISANNNFGVTTLENYANVASVSTVTTPYAVEQLNYILSTVDCGTSISIDPANRPRKSTQVQQRTPPPTGFQGDVIGTTCVDPGVTQLTVTSSTASMTLSTVDITDTSGQFSCSASPRTLVVGQQVIISGVFGGTGSITGYSDPTTYKILATNGSTTFTLVTTSGSAIVTTAGTTTGLTYTVVDSYFTTSSTSSLYIDIPVVFTGIVFGGITAGTTYYVNNIPSATNFTIATTPGGANVNLSAASGVMKVNPVQYMYVAVQDYNSTQYARTVTNTNATGNLVTLSDTTSLNPNDPIIFSGTTFGGITAGVIYYIKAVASGTTVTLSRSRTNGVADSTVVLTTASGTCTATVNVGSDIWKRIQLTNW